MIDHIIKKNEKKIACCNISTVVINENIIFIMFNLFNAGSISLHNVIKLDKTKK